LTTATLSCLVSPVERKAGLSGVKSLVLSHNYLTHIPAFVYDMPQLEELRVDNNKLVELDVTIGERLPNLRVLDLHNNELPALPPSVGHMHFLQELNLNGTRMVSYRVHRGV
jgi:Leucine-rich repeat (LRR) protein